MDQATVGQPFRVVYVVLSAVVPHKSFTKSFHKQSRELMGNNEDVAEELGVDASTSKLVWGPETIILSEDIPRIISTNVDPLYHKEKTLNSRLLVIIIFVVVAAVAISIFGLFWCLYRSPCPCCCGGTMDEEDKQFATIPVVKP